MPNDHEDDLGTTDATPTSDAPTAFDWLDEKPTPENSTPTRDLAPLDPIDDENEARDLVEVLADLNPRELRFLASYTKHGKAAQAARDAGFKTSPLATNAKLRNAVALVQRSVAVRIGYGVVEAIKELISLTKIAVEKEQIMAAVRAVETKAKLAGLLQPEAQVAVPNLTINITGVTPPAYIDAEVVHEEDE